ncbi:hypothetical protein [Bermanella sp. R86510]|uniref:hypothetical protein n=1 Tax=unclassified Bermanella TaxID=2627862 RepID=UPI0037C6773C
MMKLTVIALLMFVSTSSLAFDREAIESRLYVASNFKSSGQTVGDRIEELDKIQSEIDFELEKGTIDSELLFLKGMVIRQYAYTIEDPLTNQDLKKLKSIGKESDRWLMKSLENNIDELSLDQLYIIKKSGSQLAVKTIDKILEKDKRLIGEDNRIVELKRQKIDNLIRLGRFDEARKEMEETNQEHPTFKSAEWDEAFEGQIVEVKEKMAEQEEEPPVEAEIKDTSIKNDEVESVVDEAPKKEVGLNPKPEEVKIILIDNRYWPFLLAILAVIGLYLYSRKKQKKK